MGRTNHRRRCARSRKAWARGKLDGILSQLQPNDIAVDCGANTGEVSVAIARTGATLYAFEPDPVAFERLSANLARYPNAHSIAAAVSDRAGRATLHRSTRFRDTPLAATTGSTLLADKRDVDGTGDGDLTVPVMDLTEILRDLIARRVPDGLPGQHVGLGRLALLKIDVEGEELTLLPALHEADLLARVGCTLVETHQRKFPARRSDFLRMRRELRGLYPASKVDLDWI
ncbi:MAG: FkbM family methyltransferase [Pseudomonadota bacterium]